MPLPISPPPPVFVPLQPRTFYLRLTQVGGGGNPLFLNDIDVGEGGRSHGMAQHGYPRAGQVYVPTSGYIDLLMTDSVILSYEAGVIRGFIDAGRLSGEIRMGSGMHNGLANTFGWADYADSGVAQALVANTWTPLTNDTLSPTTNIDHLPTEVTKLWDPATNKLYLADLDDYDVILVRTNIVVTPVLNDCRLESRLNFNNLFNLTTNLGRLDSGAGIAYPRVDQVAFYVGSAAVAAGGATVEVRCSSDASVVVNSFFVKHL